MLHGEQEHFKESLVGKVEVAIVDKVLHNGPPMGARDSCKRFYEMLEDAVHEKKGSLDISLLSTHFADSMVWTQTSPTTLSWPTGPYKA